MSIAEKLTTVAENVQKVYDAGKQAEYDAFWDAFQSKGARRNYENGFYRWSNNCFYPKYDIVINEYASNTFFSSTVADLETRLQECGVALNTANTTRFSSTFQACYSLVAIPTLDCTHIENMNNAFFGDGSLKKVSLVNLGEACGFSNNFTNCTALENLSINGVIGNNGFDVHWSTGLSADSLESIINALSETKTGLTVTLPSTAQANYDAVYGDGKWAELVATKSNWSIAYTEV